MRDAVCIYISKKVKYFLFTLGILIAIVPATLLAADFTCNWTTATSGDWDTGGNWSTCSGGFPNNGANTFDAVIDAISAPYTITLNTDTTIDMLRLNSADASVLHTAGTLTANTGIILDAGEYQLRGGRIQNSTIFQNGSALAFGNSNNNQLDGVTVNGDILMDISNGKVRLQNGTSWTGDVTLNATSSRFVIEQTGVVDNTTINLNGVLSTLGLSGSNTLTLGTNATVNLNANASTISSDSVLGGDSVVNNQGVIVADGSASRNIQPDIFNNTGLVRAQNGANLSITGAITNNSGVIEAVSDTTVTIGNGADIVTNDIGGQVNATDATLAMGGNWDNTLGTINVLNATLNLGGNFTTSAIGTINRTGGTVNVTGNWDNSGDNFTFDGATGDYVLSGGTITGGVLNFGSNGLLFGNSNVNQLDGVTINGDILMNISNGDVRLQNGASWTGDARLTATSSRLIVEQTTTLDNTDIFLDGVVSTFGVSGDNTLTLGPNASVNLNGNASSISSDLIFSGNGVVNNQGLIVADNTVGGGATRNIQPDIFNNSGVVRAQNGASLSIVGNLSTNSGVIEATNGTTILLGNNNDTFSNDAGGQINATDATVSLGGNWNNGLGTINVTNSTLNLGGDFTTGIIGTINRSGGVVNVAGDWDNSGDNFTFDTTTGDYVLTGGVITGGVLNFGSNQLLFGNSNTNQLDGVTINGDILMDIVNGDVRLQNGTSWSGDARLTATSTRLIFDQSGTIDNTNIFLDGIVALLGLSGNNMLTLGAGTTVNLNANASSISSDQVLGGDSGVTNQGLIIANDSGSRTIQTDIFDNAGTVRTQNGATLNIFSTNTSNTGLIEANAGTSIVLGNINDIVTNGLGGQITATDATLSFGGNWDNTLGVISVVNSTLNLGGNFTTAGMGSIVRNGGTINVNGNWDNSGDSFTFDATSGDYVLSGGAITGGVLNFGINRLRFNNSTSNRFDGVSVTGDIVIDTINGDLRVQNGTTWSGDVFLNGIGSRFIVEQSGIVDNTTISLNGVSSILGISGTNTFTLGSNATINLNANAVNIASDQVLGGDGILENQGLIVAYSAGGSGANRAIQVDFFNNSGVVRSQNGANLTIDSINNLAGSRLEVSGGTIVIGSDLLVMPEASSLQGSGTVTAATINIAGTLAPGDATGSLALEGDVSLAATALVDIEIGGRLAGIEFDELNVAGDLLLGGDFSVSLIDGFIPDSADIFQIGMASSIGGNFNNINSGDLLVGFAGLESFRLFFGAGNPFGENTIVIATAQPVPLPPAVVLFSSLLPLLLRRRRKS